MVLDHLHHQISQGMPTYSGFMLQKNDLFAFFAMLLIDDVRENRKVLLFLCIFFHRAHWS